MAETEETVKQTEVTNDGGTQVVRKSTATASSADTRLSVVNGIWFVVGALEILLAFRLVMKLLGANPASGFVNFAYSISSVFISPFRGIFTSPTTQGDITVAVFETAVVVAMVVYALLGWGLVKLATLNKE